LAQIILHLHVGVVRSSLFSYCCQINGRRVVVVVVVVVVVDKLVVVNKK